MNIAALQLTSLPLDDVKLTYYVKAAAESNVEVLLLGEYVLNLFFHELKNLPLSMINEQSTKHLESLKILAKNYGMTILAPIISVRQKKVYKSLYRILPSGKSYSYEQQRLIAFPHWNEAAFFSNEKPEKIELCSFTHNGFKCAMVFGYELHFDEFWLEIKKQAIDIVFLPTASTFESNQRWREIIKSRAFIASTFILRANRVGEYRDESHIWRFYGDTLACGVDGNIIESLGDREELLIANINKKFIRETRKNWSIK